MSRIRTVVNPTVVFVALGAALLLTAVHHHLDELTRLDSGVGPLIALVVDTIPALGIAVAGYWLSETDLRASDRWIVCRWTLAGLSLFVAAIGATLLIRLFEGRPITEPLFPLLVAAEMGGLGGFVAGYYNARAREQAREARQTRARLDRVNEQLEASNERLEQFAYAASHDLQEPLRVVSSYLQLLEDRYGDELDEEAREFIDFAVDGADRMKGMIDSLLDYSRIDQGEPLEPTDADSVLDQVLVDLQMQVAETEATVTAEALPTVEADRDQLTQLFQNLISNALAYATDAPRVHVGVERAGEEWRFFVADDGVGIDADQQAQIFDMFQQATRGHEAAGQGASGIGLAMCERIVDRHDGEIWVESEPGTGSIFYFTLPAADDQQAESLEESQVVTT